jgi:hypothetical protein
LQLLNYILIHWWIKQQNKNSSIKLGQTHIVEGARITDELINKCIGGHKCFKDNSYSYKNKVITLGVDVGRWLHYVVYEWTIPAETPYNDLNSYAVPRLIDYGKVPDFHSLDNLIDKFGVHFTVIDANPERRLAFAFVQKHFGRAKMCFYTRGVSGRQTVPSPENDQAINVDRTSWLDMSLGRFHSGTKGIVLPIDIDLEFRENLKSQIREYLKTPMVTQLVSITRQKTFLTTMVMHVTTLR